jgi:hypothetical protein
MFGKVLDACVAIPNEFFGKSNLHNVARFSYHSANLADSFAQELG